MKKALLSSFAILLALCAFIVFPVCAEEEFIDESDIISIEYQAPYDSTEVFEDYFDAEELKARIRAAVLNYEQNLDIWEYRIPSSMLAELYAFFSDNFTDCFHVNLAGCTKYGNSDFLVKMVFEYLVEEEKYEEYKAIWDAKIESYLEGVDDSLTDVQKALILHDRIALRCDYDKENADAGTLPLASYTPFGVVINEVAVCQGYAELYSYLLSCVGIKSYLCSSDVMVHVWNIVVIDGEYYYVDVTWDDPVWDVSGRVTHTNFLCSYEDFKKHHHKNGVIDYDTTPSSTRFDDSFWRDSISSFQLIGDEIYYVDYEDARIETYDGEPVWDVDVYWMMNEEGYYWQGCYTYLASCGDFLLFNMPDSIYVFDTVSKKAKKVLTPDNPYSTIEATYNIYGFREKDGQLLLEFNNNPNFLRDTKKNYTVTVDIDENWFLVDVESVSLNITEKELTEGEAFTLNATVAPENASNKNVVWTSSDESIATVIGGVVTAKKAGRVTITAITEDGGKSAECVLTVKEKIIPVTGISLDLTEKELIEGEAFTLNATVAPENASNKNVVWTSSDESVATVIGGVVTAKKAGRVTITAITEDGGKSAECVLTVKEKIVPVTGISLDISEKELIEGEAFTLNATVAPENATNKNVIWRSTDEDVATVIDGVVTAKKAGNATIMAITEDGGKVAECALKVSPKPIDPNALTFKFGDANVIAGNLVRVTFDVTNNSGFSKMAFRFDYNRSVMTLVGYECSTQWKATPDSEENPECFIWERTSDYNTNGTLLTLIFETKEDAPVGDYGIKAVCLEAVTNQALEELEFNLVSGKISIKDDVSGDSNGDKEIDVKDAVIVAQSLAGWGVVISDDAADCNGDGFVDVKDAVLLAQFLAGWNVHFGRQFNR
ncbi:MAG: Ig-like domain-containing protein [Clostridia bacterium]|nr:Ig-like domain-containing protein [Clostridia bacterium]